VIFDASEMPISYQLFVAESVSADSKLVPVQKSKDDHAHTSLKGYLSIEIPFNPY
jgi:hypothetical protein